MVFESVYVCSVFCECCTCVRECFVCGHKKSWLAKQWKWLWMKQHGLRQNACECISGNLEISRKIWILIIWREDKKWLAFKQKIKLMLKMVITRPSIIAVMQGCEWEAWLYLKCNTIFSKQQLFFRINPGRVFDFIWKVIVLWLHEWVCRG